MAFALGELLLALGDDELILGQRNSEWCAHAPILEEDIAFANLALDEIGHAVAWYAVLAALTGTDPQDYPDRLAFHRSPEEFRNIQMVELPKGDWAFSMLRQYLFDAAEKVRLPALGASTYTPLAETAAKIIPEEAYHFRHTRAWIRRLGLGTEESHHRLQSALESLWPYTAQLFLPLDAEDRLAAAGIYPGSSALRLEWESLVIPDLEVCNLTVPGQTGSPPRRQDHTAHLKVLLSEMQSVARLEPHAEW